MKKILFCVFAACFAFAMTFTTGCKTTPSVDSMYTISYSIGRTAGFAVEMSSASQEIKEGIVDVLDIASETVPGTNETFVVKWTPIVDKEVQKLIDGGKLTSDSAKVVKHALYVACEGIDLIFVRYPVAKQYKELVSSAVDGFCVGFKSIISGTMLADVGIGIDTDAYRYLKAKSVEYIKAENK